MSICREILNRLALTEKEYRLIVQRLGREPGEVELAMFGSLWSEHCAYKHSKPLLKLLPSRGKRVVIGPGEENAGVVDLGEGWVVVMKIESHNHPSAVEPYQGAATGVGGIVRDIFTMGARPVALLNSLRFGPLSDSRNRYIFNGVIGGIAWYGNCLGIPNVGGEVFFSHCYSANPLVNVLCLGVARKEELVRARACGAGNILMLVGAETGRDGIYGASGLASRTFEDEQELRSTVQIGNPFLEKLLIEACLEVARKGWVIGMQDLGAAGLTSAAVESAARGGGGVEIDVLKVPRREEGLTPYEVMLSESQERMLVIVKRGYEERVKEIFRRWELPCEIIGQVTDTGFVVIKEGEKTIAEVPVNLLTSPPLYRKRGKRPAWLNGLQSLDLNAIPDLRPEQCNSVLLRLLASPNVASKRYIYRQYDHQVMNNSVVLPGSDAAVLRIKGTKKGISLTTDGNGRYCYVDPFVGGIIAVAEAARNLVCSGAQPLAITDCLNFGNPEKDEIYYQLKECIRGIARACRKLQIPVISGNVSLYNETKGEAVYPTPVVGMLGIMEDVERHCSMSFRKAGDLVFVLGPVFPCGDYAVSYCGLGASEYLELVHGLVKGKPSIDLNMEKKVQRCCLEAIRRGIVRSAHDSSEGGLLVAIAESCIAGDIGFEGKGWSVKGRLDAFFFGECQSRIVVSVPEDGMVKLAEVAERWQVPLTFLGTVGGKRLTIEGYIDLPVAEIAKAWYSFPS